MLLCRVSVGDCEPESPWSRAGGSMLNDRVCVPKRWAEEYRGTGDREQAADSSEASSGECKTDLFAVFHHKRGEERKGRKSHEIVGSAWNEDVTIGKESEVSTQLRCCFETKQFKSTAKNPEINEDGRDKAWKVSSTCCAGKRGGECEVIGRITKGSGSQENNKKPNRLLLPDVCP